MTDVHEIVRQHKLTETDAVHPCADEHQLELSAWARSRNLSPCGDQRVERLRPEDHGAVPCNDLGMRRYSAALPCGLAIDGLPEAEIQRIDQPPDLGAIQSISRSDPLGLDLGSDDQSGGGANGHSPPGSLKSSE